MDYNYVRMRNARREGDEENAGKYKRMYEAGMETRTPTQTPNYVIALLAVIAAALFIYITYINGAPQNTAAPDSEYAEQTARGV